MSSDQQNESYIINITENGLTINATAFSFPIDVAALKLVLGEPVYYKKWSKDGNHIYTWDNLGIYAYSKNSDYVECLAFHLIAGENYKYLPKAVFNQHLQIDGTTIAAFYAANAAQLDKYHSYHWGNLSLYMGANKENNIETFQVQQFIPPPPKKVSDKYVYKKVDSEIIPFKDFNFKLAVIQVLMYQKKLLQPVFDLYEFVDLYDKREIDIEAEGYEFIPEVTDYFMKLEIDKKFANEITEIHQDGGDDIYGSMLRFWDGEDDVFNIQSLDDLDHFKNLKKVSFFCDKPTDVVTQLKEKGIEYVWG